MSEGTRLYRTTDAIGYNEYWMDPLSPDEASQMGPATPGRFFTDAELEALKRAYFEAGYDAGWSRKAMQLNWCPEKSFEEYESSKKGK